MQNRRNLASLMAISALAVALMRASGAAIGAGEFTPVRCQGSYKQHLQGVCAGPDALYWCFTDQLVKTDAGGKVQKQVPVRSHHGDPCYHEGQVYVAANFGSFNRNDGQADSWVYAYDADDLSLVAKHPVPEVVYGAGGIAAHAGRFLVVGGLPLDRAENYAYEYDAQFKFVQKHVLKSGLTLMGIQTAEFADGHWWFGCYGLPATLLKADEGLTTVQRFDFDCSLGMIPAGPGRFLVARGDYSKEAGYSGRLVLAKTDPERGLVLEKDEPPGR